MAAARKKKNMKAAEEAVPSTETMALAEEINESETVNVSDGFSPVAHESENKETNPGIMDPDETQGQEKTEESDKNAASGDSIEKAESAVSEKTAEDVDKCVASDAEAEPKVKTIKAPEKEQEYEKKEEIKAEPVLTANKMEPDSGKRVIKPSVQYSKSAEREKNIRRQVKKRKRRPVLLVLFLCSMLVLVAIVYNSITREPEQVTEEAAPAIETPVTEIIVPTPPPNQVNTEEPDPSAAAVEEIPEESGQETGQPGEEPAEPVVEHSYQFIVEDISWEAARQRCQEMGGYLAVITDVNELEQIIQMAENNGVSHVWLGCHRVDGQLVWEYDGDYYYQWDVGEPSAYDYNDNVAEDYLMFWQHNGYWYYNDSRNDPCSDYPAYYSGDMGYVCEFGSN